MGYSLRGIRVWLRTWAWHAASTPSRRHGDDGGRRARPTLVLAMLLMVSRLMGFVRSQVMAALFGATGETDAFIVAV